MFKVRWSRLLAVTACCVMAALTSSAAAQQKKPNILVVWDDDIGQCNTNAYSIGMLGYQTPNIDLIAREGIISTDYYGEQSCTAGRASYMLGKRALRTRIKSVPDGEIEDTRPLINKKRMETVDDETVSLDQVVEKMLSPR